MKASTFGQTHSMQLRAPYTRSSPRLASIGTRPAVSRAVWRVCSHGRQPTDRTIGTYRDAPCASPNARFNSSLNTCLQQLHHASSSGNSCIQLEVPTPRNPLLSNAQSARNRSITIPSGAVGEAYNIADKPATPPTGRAVIVGGGSSGLAAAIGLARRAGFAVDVFDSTPDPSRNKNALGASLLVALGARGLQALTDLGITLTVPPNTADDDSSSSSSSGSSISGKTVYSVSIDDPSTSTPTDSSTIATTASQGAVKGPSGLMMLQGLVVLGPDGKKRAEKFAKGGRRDESAVPGGIAVIDSYTLTTALEAEATRSTAAAPAAPAAGKSTASVGPILGYKADSPTAAAVSGAALGGKTGAAGAQQASAAAAASDDGGVVKCHYESELVLVDTLNKQATFKGPNGEARVMPYDILVGAQQPGSPGTTLISAALAEIQQRTEAHKHPGARVHKGIYSSPAAAAASGADTATLAAAALASGSIAAAAAGSDAEAAAAQGKVGAAAAGGDAFVELEYKGWQNMPHQQDLEGLVPLGATQSRHSPQTGPTSGWLLVWSTTTATLPRTAPNTSSAKAAGSSPADGIPGGPSCTVMAWPGKGGGTWAGAVFTAPQVFESLRSQSDYEGLLRGLRCVDASAGSNMSGLPGIWVKGIAAQLKSAAVGRVPAPAVPPPKHLSAPSAGVTLLSPAATLTSSPQLLCPGVALGLQDAAALAAAVADAVGSAAGGGGAVVTGNGSSSAAQTAWSVERGLNVFDKERRQQVAALQQLEAQLSYLRHPFSPAATAAAASIPPLTLAWLTKLIFQSPRSGLALQWKCMLAVLPTIAAMSKVLGIAVQGYSGAASSSSSSNNIGDNLAEIGPMAAGLRDVLGAVKPSGGSFMAFVNTTVMSFPGVWRLLQIAPLLASLLWAAAVFVVVKVVQWCIFAVRVWGVSQAAA